jgi:hypothetical protein
MLKLLTTVAILGALYLFVARPIIDAGSELTRHQADRAQRVVTCVDRAGTDVDRLSGCARRASPK